MIVSLVSSYRYSSSSLICLLKASIPLERDSWFHSLSGLRFLKNGDIACLSPDLSGFEFSAGSPVGVGTKPVPLSF